MKKFFTLDTAIEFYKITKDLKLPPHLKDQFQRAASSIVLNLSEGSAKPTARDRARFYHTALGSLREVQIILILAESDDSAVKKADFLGGCLYRLAKNTQQQTP